MEANLTKITNVSPIKFPNRNIKFIVAGYPRVSPKGTGRHEKEEASLEIQTKDMAKELQERKSEWRLYDIYGETVSGGLSFENRSRGVDLLRDAREGKFNLVLIWDNDRLGRDREGMAAQLFRSEMRRLGIQIYSLHQPQILKDPDEFLQDPYDDGVILMEKIQDWQSASTINKFVHRSIRGKLERAARGEFLTTPNYGFKLEIIKKENGEPLIRKDGRVVYKRVIDEDEKLYVIRIYKAYVFEGKSMNEIRDGLNKDGVPTRKGRSWERAMVDRILTNPIYYGALIYNKHFRRKASLSGKCRWGVNPEDKWVIVEPERTEIKPIIEKEVFDKAQEVRKAKLRLGAVSVYNDYLFSGLAKCGVCGNKMYSRKVESRYRRKSDGVKTKSYCHGYVCGRWARFNDTYKNYISEKDIKTILINDLKKYKDNLQVLEGFLKAASFRQKDNDSKMLKTIKKNLEKIEDRRSRLIVLFEKQKISEKEFDDATDALEAERQGNETEMNRLYTEMSNKTKRRIGRRDFKRSVRNFERVFRNKDRKVQKLFLRSLIDNIVIKQDEVAINYLL